MSSSSSSSSSSSNANKTYQLFVHALTGKTIAIDCFSDDTVLNVKERIQNKQGLNVSAFFLLYDGHVLESERPIKFYNIKHSSTLRMGFRLRVDSKANEEYVVKEGKMFY